MDSKEEDLFETNVENAFDCFVAELDKLAEEITSEWQLPPQGVIVKRTIGTGEKTGTNGKIVSYVICANEPPYPESSNKLLNGKRTQTPFLTIPVPKTKKWQGFVEINVASSFLPKLPEGARVIPRENKDEGVDSDSRLLIPLDSPEIYGFIRQIVSQKLSQYVSSAGTFGCCDRYIACSDAKKCIHPNRLYSTACAYRRNLENGRIFYGKNCNV